MWYQRWYSPPTVGELRLRASERVRELRKAGTRIAPVDPISGNRIAKTFWGKAWCENLLRYSDFENRMPRGRKYVRTGSGGTLPPAGARPWTLPIFPRSSGSTSRTNPRPPDRRERGPCTGDRAGPDPRPGERDGPLRDFHPDRCASRGPLEIPLPPVRRRDRIAGGTALRQAARAGDGDREPTRGGALPVARGDLAGLFLPGLGGDVQARRGCDVRRRGAAGPRPGTALHPAGGERRRPGGRGGRGGGGPVRRRSARLGGSGGPLWGRDRDGAAIRGRGAPGEEGRAEEGSREEGGAEEGSREEGHAEEGSRKKVTRKKATRKKAARKKATRKKAGRKAVRRKAVRQQAPPSRET